MDESRRTWRPRPVSAVYLKGDPQALYIDLTQEALLTQLADATLFVTEQSADPEDCFLKLPLTTGPDRNAFVKPRSIAAVLPATLGADDDD